MLFSLNHVAKNKETYLENYWLKNKRAVDKGKTGPTYAWVIPATQHAQGGRGRGGERARTQGLEFQSRTSSFKAGNVARQGRRLHRPRRPAVPHAGRHVLLDPELSRRRTRRRTTTPAGRSSSCGTSTSPVTDKSVLDQQMTLLTADATAPGGIDGSGSTVIVENTGDNTLVTFRFKNAEREDAGGGGGVRARRPQLPRRRDHHRRTPNRAQLEPMLKELGCRRGRSRRRRR